MKKTILLVITFILLFSIPLQNGKNKIKENNLAANEDIIAVNSNRELSEEEKKQITYEFLSEITNNELFKKDLYNKLKEQEEKYGSKIEGWKLLK